jgi:hypothetical protein
MLLPSEADASLSLSFDRTVGRPGDVVHLHTTGRGACLVCPKHMSLYFVSTRVSESIRSPNDGQLVGVGTLLIDALGNGTGQFRVPDVKVGPYILMAYCQPCATDSAGRVMLPVGPFPSFKVVGETSNALPRWLWILAGTGMAVTVGALIVLLFRKRRVRD